MIRLIMSFLYATYYYLLGTLATFEDHLYRASNKCELVDRCGRVAVITGGARGIGAEVVKKLLQCNMHVIIGCRNIDRGLDLVRRLRASGITSGSASVLPLDLSSLDSVRPFATAVIKARPSVHLLINNAGIMFPPYSETVDGFESQWGVNYMSHFLLTHLLMPALQRAATSVGDATGARVVNMSSCAHKAARPIDFNDLNMKSRFVTQAAYAQSKLAQLLFTLHLARSPAAASVSFVAVHPGVVDTDLFDGTLMKTLTPWAPRLLFKTVEEGATTVMYAALHARNGEYISNGRPASKSRMADDRRLQEKLFEHSLHTLGIKSFGNVL